MRTPSLFSSLLLASLMALAVGCPAPDSPEDAGTTSVADAGTTPVADAGTTPVADAGTTPVACGDITLQGECQGSILRYCQDEQLFELDCSTEYFPDGVTATCGEIDANWGFDCRLANDETCIFTDEVGTFTGFCEEGSACISDLTADTTTCKPEISTCVSPAADADFVPICSGDILFLDCTAGQPYGLYCENGCAEGACLNMAEGQLCNANLSCAEGLVCTDQICVSAGTADAGTADAGTADAGTADAGTADAG